MHLRFAIGHSRLVVRARAPRRPVRPASRHPPASCRAARRSPLPVAGGSRAGATTRRARPSASGRGERLKSAARWHQASTPHGTTTRGAPPSDAKYTKIYGTDSRGESAKARARGPSTPARGANRQRTAPLAARVEARGNGNGWGGPDGRWAIGSRPIAPAGLQKYRRCGFHALLDETGALSRLCIIWHLGSAG